MPTQPRALKTREKLLNAAQHCFAEYGYDATGVALICDEAHVSKGAFYHHFDSKQALFLALMQSWLGDLDEQLASFESSMDSVPEGLRSMTSLLGAVLAMGSDQLPMYLEFWSKATREKEIWEETIAPFHRYQEFFAEILEAGMKEGTIRRLPSDGAARVLVAFAVGLLMQGLLEPKGTNWSAVSDLGMDILMHGLTEDNNQ